MKGVNSTLFAFINSVFTTKKLFSGLDPLNDFLIFSGYVVCVRLKLLENMLVLTIHLRDICGADYLLIFIVIPVKTGQIF